jgi:hypothetical protein
VPSHSPVIGSGTLPQGPRISVVVTGSAVDMRVSGPVASSGDFSISSTHGRGTSGLVVVVSGTPGPLLVAMMGVV